MQPRRNGDGKEFVSHAPGYWPDVKPELWNDWKWQLKNRVTSLAQLESRDRGIDLSDEERSGVLLSGDKLALAVTPHFFNLIPREKNPDDPIRRHTVAFACPGKPRENFSPRSQSALSSRFSRR